jgi:hypothetical protein
MHELTALKFECIPILTHEWSLRKIISKRENQI